MSGYLGEIEDELSRMGTQPIRATDLAKVVRAIGSLAASIRNDREFIDALEARLMIVDDLPLEAPFGALIRRRGTASLYLGNGEGQPLSRLVPQALP